MTESSKEISITPTMTSILKPTGDYLGAELKNFVQSRVEKAKEAKKSQNIEAHLEQVRTKTSNNKSKEASYHQLDLFEEWIDGASKVDPQDKRLSDLWHNLLLDSRNSFNSEVMLEKLKQVSSGDALTLIKIHKKSSLTREDRYRIDKLQSLELVEKNEMKISLIQFLLMMAVFLIGIIGAFSIFSAPTFISESPNILRFSLPLLPFLFLGSIIFVLIKKAKSGSLRIWQLTWLGERLISLSK